MESSISRRFNNLIAVHLDVNKLITEGTNISNAKSSPNKKMKSCTKETSPDNVIGKLIGKEVSKILNSGLYLSGYNSFEELLDSHLNSIIELHKDGQCYKREMIKIIEFIEMSIYEKVFNTRLVTTTVLKIIVNLPLNFLWRLAKLEVLTLDQVIHRFGCSRNGTERLLNDIYKLIFKLIKDESAEEILKDIFITLIKIIYELKDLEGKFDATKNVARNVLIGIIEQILKRLDEAERDPEKSITDENFVNIYDSLSEYSVLYKRNIEQFTSQQLIHILSFEPKLSLKLAIERQSQWRSTKVNKTLTSVFLAIAKLIGCNGSFSTLDEVVNTMEVNWSYIFSFLGTLLLTFPEASAKLKDEIDQYIKNGCNSQETEFLILGFLYARLASLEGRHIFPAYPQWFASTFGAEVTSPANNKQSFIFLMKFLTSLVPYDSPEILKAQINQSIFIPKGSQLDYREYQKIARCRLDDLKENVPSCVQSKSIENEKAISEVEAAILQYEETRKVPSFILEASIFQRNYYLTHFVPELLKPRRLPDTPDSRMSLIDELHKLSKISNKTYQNYKTQSKAIVDLPSNFSKIEEESHPCRETIEKYLSEFLSLIRSDEGRRDDDDDHKCMSILSKLAEVMEEATKDLNTDMKNQMSSGVVLTTLNFESNAVHFRITSRILEAIESLLALKEKKNTFRHRVGQLLVLLASTSSLQVALILTIIQRIKLFQEEKIYSEREVEFLGILCGEILNHSEMFLQMKLSPVPDVKDSTIEDLIVEIIPVESIYYVYSASLLQQALVWVSQNHQAENSVKVQNPNRKSFKKIEILYFCISSRTLAYGTTNMIQPEEGIDLISITSEQLPPVIGKQTYKCCQYLIENISLIVKKVTFENWIAFEMDSPWTDIPISSRVNHHLHWFKIFFPDKETEMGFSFLFWKLLDVGANKKNSSEMLILLQRLAFDVSSSSVSFSLLQEWKKWKSSFRKDKTKDEESDITREYHTKLMSFICLCHTFPVTLLIGKKVSITTLNIFQHLIIDILDANGEIFLDLRNTLLLLECFLEVAKYLNPPEGLLKDSFSLLKESVLFRHRDTLPLLLKYSKTLEKHGSLQFLLQIDVNSDSTFKSLPEKEFAIIISAIACNELNVPSSISFQSVSFLAAVLGRNLIINEEFSNLDKNNWPQPLKKLLKVGTNIISSVGYSPDINYLLSTWKKLSLAPMFYKALILGMNYLIRIKLTKDMSKISTQHTTWLYSLLLTCWIELTTLFEEKLGKEEPSLGYLSFIFTQIHSLTKSLPVACLKRVDENILSKVDKEISSLIRQLIFSKSSK